MAFAWDAAHAEAEPGVEGFEQAMATDEGHADAEVDDANPGGAGGLGGGFPVARDLGEEAAADAGGFGEFLLAAVAVDTDAGGDDEDFGGLWAGGDGVGDEAGAVDAAGADAIAFAFGPASESDGFAGEVDHGVESVEGALGDLAAFGPGAGVPEDFAGGGVSADKADDIVPGGGEDGAERGADGAGGAADAYAEPLGRSLPGGEVGVEGEVGLGAGVPEGEEAFEVAFDAWAGEAPGEGVEREGELNGVGKDGGPAHDPGGDLVGVNPVREGALALLVDEALAWEKPGVGGVPGEGDGPGPGAEDDTATIANAAGLADEADFLPRGSEALERAGAFVPREEGGGVDGEGGSGDERGHASQVTNTGSEGRGAGRSSGWSTRVERITLRGDHSGDYARVAMNEPMVGSIAEQRLDGFLAALGAKTPTPGGGAASGVVGALGAALARMVVSYSVGKKSLAAHEGPLRESLETLERGVGMLLRLAEEDAAAYGLVNELSRLPEGDPRREREWGEAVRAGVDVPLAMMAACVELLRRFEGLCGTSNAHLRSDLAIAAILAEAGARSARWNVLVNAPNIAEPARTQDLAAASHLMSEALRLSGVVESRCAQG